MFFTVNIMDVLGLVCFYAFLTCGSVAVIALDPLENLCKYGGAGRFFITQ